MDYTISFKVNVKEGTPVELLKRLEHHAEELLDLDSWPEIETVHDFKVEEEKKTRIVTLCATDTSEPDNRQCDEESIEALWEQFEDIPMDPETECMEEPFLHFPAGTHREEIWKWFDENYSKGVHALLYGE